MNIVISFKHKFALARFILMLGDHESTIIGKDGIITATWLDVPEHLCSELLEQLYINDLIIRCVLEK